MVTKIKKKKTIVVDEFVAWPNRLVEYVKENLKQIIIVSVICILIISTFFLGKAWWEKKKEKGFFLYAQAQNLLKKGEKEKAIKTLIQIADTHTPVAKFANLSLADFYREKQPEKELNFYIAYIQKAKDEDPLLPFVYYSLAVYYLNHKHWLEAEKILKTIVEKWQNHFLSAWAYAHLGLLTEKKNPLKAIKMYQLALKYKNSPLLPIWVELKTKGIIPQYTP